MSTVNYSRIGAFFICLALITTRGFAAYIPEDEISQQSSHVLKRAYMGLRLMCEAHPRNCADAFRKRSYNVQNIESGKSYESPDSIAQQLENMIKWRQELIREREAKRSQQQARLLEAYRRSSYSKRR